MTVTGGIGAWARIFDAISWSQIRSFGLAFMIISLIMVGIFGSLKLGLVAVVPNTFPMLTVFGLMGWFGFKLDTTTLLTAPIIIGVAVDDTIHFITHYRLSVLRGAGQQAGQRSFAENRTHYFSVMLSLLMKKQVAGHYVYHVGNCGNADQSECNVK